MNSDMKRALVAGRYKGDAWAKKVEKMPDEQVTAIFLRMKAAGMFEMKPKPTHVTAKECQKILCPCCYREYTVDSTETEEECRYCGARLRSRIKKEL